MVLYNVWGTCVRVCALSFWFDQVVDACIASSTHYVDITGEATFVRKVIDKHHDAAVRKKLKVTCRYVVIRCCVSTKKCSTGLLCTIISFVIIQLCDEAPSHPASPVVLTQIVPCCGFDCVPVDMGCSVVVAEMKRRGIVPERVFTTLMKMVRRSQHASPHWNSHQIIT